VEQNEGVSQLFVHFRNAYISVGREVLYNILTEFGVPMKQVRLTKMSLKETYRKFRVGTDLSDNCPIQNGLKQGDASCHCFSILLKTVPLGMSRKTSWD
jgi:hypothetical protein